MNPQIEEELITCINYDTKTVNLLDRFEGFDKQGFVYKRIVIKNPIFKVYYHNLTVNYHLVIERRSELDYVGDITFTRLKKGDTNELNQHIKSEITNDIINKYIDKNRFY